MKMTKYFLLPLAVIAFTTAMAQTKTAKLATTSMSMI
jgi:hypothetical protein